MHRLLNLSLALILGASVGCQSVYYSSLEKLGIEKRDVLVDRVEDARDQQEATKETFTDALQAFTTATGYEGGELEKTYDRLNKAYERSQRSAARVAERIDKVEAVAQALFSEWEKELEEYSSSNLRRESERSLRDTQSSYNTMIAKMRQAEEMMDPVLDLFRDQVLYLKHNLNARAIAALDKEVRSIQGQVENLVREMEASIAEANDFIASMR